MSATTPCRLHVRVEPARIIYLNGVLDSYEGIGIMRTEDEKSGKVIIYTTQHDETILRQMIAALQSEGLDVAITACDYEDIVG